MNYNILLFYKTPMAPIISNFITQKYINTDVIGILEKLLKKIEELGETDIPIKLHMSEINISDNSATFNVINNPHSLDIKTGIFTSDDCGLIVNFFCENFKNIYKEDYMAPRIFRSLFKKIEYENLSHEIVYSPTTDYIAETTIIKKTVNCEYTNFSNGTYLHTGYTLITFNDKINNDYLGSTLFFKHTGHSPDDESFLPCKMFIFDENNNIIISNIDSEVILYDT